MKRKQVLALLLAAAMTANMAMPARAALAAPVSGSIFYQSESVKTVTEEDLAAALAATVKSNGEEDESNGAEKEETVYVFTDASGRQKSMTVSSWLKNKNGADKLYDNSILENIENVKGDEPFTQSGDILTWNAAGNDIYYQGTTDKQPPVTQKITYYLDGREIAPEDLAGKSGKVRIHIDYENTEKYEDVYVPFTTVTGIIFSNDNAGNVEVDNGSVISEGKNTVVVGMAFPGLADSLQVVKDDAEHLLEETEASQKSKDRVNDIEIPDSVDITLDATEFKMSTCMTMVFSGLLDDDKDTDEDHESILHDMDEKMEDLQKDGNDLADGAGELSDGIIEASDGTGELNDGAEQLADGVKEYTDGVSKVNDGAEQIKDGTDKLVKNLPELTGGLRQYTDGVAQVNKGAGQLADGIKKYTDGVSKVNDGAGQLKDGTDQLVKNLPAFSEGLGQYTDGVKKVDEGLGQIAEKIPEFTDGTSALSGGLEQVGQGMNDLTEGIGTLKEGTKQLADNSDALNGAAGQLSEGADQLKAGIAQYTAGAGQLKTGTEQLLDEEKGIPALYTGAESLENGIGSYTAAVSDASGKIGAGAGQIGEAVSGAQEAIGKIGAAKESIGTLADGANTVASGAAGIKESVDNSILPIVSAIEDTAQDVSTDSAIQDGPEMQGSKRMSTARSSVCSPKTSRTEKILRGALQAWRRKRSLISWMALRMRRMGK